MEALLAVPVVRLRNGPAAGKTFEVHNALRVGRHPYNEVSLSDPAASRYHCWITATDTGMFVEDLASSNGTWINGRQVQVRQKLNAGDVLRVGSTEILFSEEE
jgi:pSer/pThr/pTyr-binding forkhead associated (FHA) protein